MDNLLKLVYTLGKILPDGVSIRQLSIDSKVPYTTAYRLITSSSIFIITKKSNLKICSLNTTDSITKNYLILAERFKFNQFKRNNPLFNILKKELLNGDYAVILFGSRAEEKQRKNSDVDLCIINKNGKKNIDFSKFELLSKLDVNTLFFTKREFKLMLKEKEHNVGKEIIKKHIILYGEEYFWNIVWENKN